MNVNETAERISLFATWVQTVASIAQCDLDVFGLYRGYSGSAQITSPWCIIVTYLAIIMDSDTLKSIRNSLATAETSVLHLCQLLYILDNFTPRRLPALRVVLSSCNNDIVRP